jgi:molybdenum cofactor synthesis domain-containing protein
LEIISVGNELLLGKTLNTNAQWLASKITSLVLSVKKINVVGDNLVDIANSVKESIVRSPVFIIVTGGLGPTFDDMTLKGVAKGLDLNLEENKQALNMVREKYQEFKKHGYVGKTVLTPHRTKMAKLPAGSKPIPNPVGTAPGVLIQKKNVNIVMLPGVPKEMMAMFDESIFPLLKKLSDGLIFFETSIYIRNIGESELAPLIDKIMSTHKNIYVKSHPKMDQKKPEIELHFSTTSKKTGLARKKIGNAIVQISELIEKKGGTIKISKIHQEKKGES